MKHEKFTVEHYIDNLDYYKDELSFFVMAELNFDVLSGRPESFKADDDILISYIVDRYNVIYLTDNLDKYINADLFIKALNFDKEDKDRFVVSLRNDADNEYHNEFEQFVRDLTKFIISDEATYSEKMTAGLLANEDPKGLLIYLKKAYDIYQKRKFGSESVMSIITNPEKLDLLINDNEMIISVLTQTIIDNMDKIKENYKNGLSESGLLHTAEET
ncbi:MAG: hypothetical protein ACI4F5_04590 [Acutalibacteraceae bacterium]